MTSRLSAVSQSSDLLEGGVAGVGGVEDLVQLLESKTLGLNQEEVEEHGLKEIPDDVDDEEPPADGLNTEGNGVVVDSEGEVGDETRDTHTLDTGGVVKTLDGVQGLHRSPGDGVGDIEGEDTEDGEGSDTVLDLGDTDGNAREPDTEETGTGDQHLPATDLVGKAGTDEDSAQELDDGLNTVDEELGVLVSDTGGVHDGGSEVGEDGGSGHLTTESDDEHHQETVTAVVVLEETRVIPETLVGTVGGDRGNHLLVLELNERSVGVTLSVVAGKDGTGLLVAAVSNQPTGGLGHNEDTSHDEDGGDQLSPEGNPPGSVTLNAVGTVRHPGGDDETDEPESVVSTTDGTTVLGRGELNDVGRSGSTGNVDTETGAETTNQHDSVTGTVAVVGDGHEDGTDGDDGGTGEHTDTTTPLVGNGTSDEGGDPGSDLVEHHHGGHTGGLTLDPPVSGELLHGVDRSHKGTIVTVHGGGPETEEEEEVKLLHPRGRPGWGLDVGERDGIAGLNVLSFVLLSGGHLLGLFVGC